MKNSTYKYKAILSVFALSFFGCKKNIDVNLNNAPPQIVITGEVNNLAGPYTVTISKTVSYASDNAYPTVSDALAIITGNGSIDTLIESPAGTYKTRSLVGVPGATYSLYVKVDGQVYFASSTMPQQVPLDSIGFSNRGKHENKISAIVYFKDPAGIANHYQFRESVNGSYLVNSNGLIVFDDRLSDGRYISNTIMDESTDLKVGDLLTMEMKCIDPHVFGYWFALGQITNSKGFRGPTPANPATNISNHALGYFSANTKQIKTAFVHLK